MGAEGNGWEEQEPGHILGEVSKMKVEPAFVVDVTSLAADVWF